MHGVEAVRRFDPSAGSPDARRIGAAALLRALAIGAVAIILAARLVERGFDPVEIGLVASAGLAGTALTAAVATLAADRVGRRRFQMAVAILCGVGGATLAFTSSPPLAMLAAFLGMVNAMGRDRGAGLLLDQAMLADLLPDSERTAALAGYNVLQDLGHALGALAAAIPTLAAGAFGVDPAIALRAALVVAAVALASTAALYGGLSRIADGARTRPARAPLGSRSRSIVIRLCALFAVDSLAGGFLTATLLAYFFFERFEASAATVALLFFGARLANAASHAGAAWLARRIGLVNTMVFTHLPSSLLLATVPFAPDFSTAAALFLLREGLVEMDVPTRHSYVLAVVRPEERTIASGATLLVRMAGWAIAPVLAGAIMAEGSLAAPLFLCAALKVAYDLALWFSFRHLPPPEEGGRVQR